MLAFMRTSRHAVPKREARHLGEKQHACFAVGRTGALSFQFPETEARCVGAVNRTRIMEKQGPVSRDGRAEEIK